MARTAEQDFERDPEDAAAPRRRNPLPLLVAATFVICGGASAARDPALWPDWVSSLAQPAQARQPSGAAVGIVVAGTQTAAGRIHTQLQTGETPSPVARTPDPVWGPSAGSGSGLDVGRAPPRAETVSAPARTPLQVWQDAWTAARDGRQPSVRTPDLETDDRPLAAAPATAPFPPPAPAAAEPVSVQGDTGFRRTAVYKDQLEKSETFKDPQAKQAPQKRAPTAVAAAVAGERNGRAARSAPPPKAPGPRIAHPRPLPPPSPAWQITHAAWTAADEAGFEAFITRMGESDCATLHDCLTDPDVNPGFYDAHPERFRFLADCADLPYMLRAYYAWRSGLPFSFSSALEALPTAEDADNTLAPTMVTERRDVVGPTPPPAAVFEEIRNTVWTAHFRNPGTLDETMPARALATDTYPVAIDRQGVRPGTMVFSPNGHVAIVYDVTEDGRIKLLDANPDNALSRSIYNRAYRRDHPSLGAGFRRWRPQTLVGARTGPDGALVGGAVALARDAEIADWSDVQYVGTTPEPPASWRRAEFAIDGATLDFHDYVRVTLAGPGFAYQPVLETQRMLREVCRQLQDRVSAVDRAVAAGMTGRAQPGRLPLNIYATIGDWETYATPARDLRLRKSVQILREQVVRFLNMDWADDPFLDYDGEDLQGAIAQAYAKEASACAVTYRKSDGALQTLAFETALDRLFDLSFDPYHCPERRWGATGAELESCPDGALKTAWYEAQAPLRNAMQQSFGPVMGWTLAEMVSGRGGDSGSDDRPEISLAAVLEPQG